MRAILSCSICLIVALCCQACGTVTKRHEFTQKEIEAESLRQRTLAVASELQQRRRLADQAFTLNVAALPECGSLKSYQSGIDLIGSGAFNAQFAEGAQALGFGDVPSVVSVAKGSPAATAGVQVGDQLLAINGNRSWHDGANAYRETLHSLREAQKDGAKVSVQLKRRGIVMEKSFVPVQGCDIAALIVRSGRPEPRANGTAALFPYHMLRLATTSDELAIVVSFGIASVINKLGVPFNEEQAHNFRTSEYTALSEMNDARLFVSDVTVFDKEVQDADRYAVDLMRRIGINPAGSAQFWRKIISRNMLSAKDNWGGRLINIDRLVQLEKLGQGQPARY